MAFERIGLGGFLKFDERTAVRGMDNARKGFARLKKGAGQVGAGLARIGGGMRNTALALAPITAGLGFGIAKAASFEKQMSAVGAITRSSTKDLAKLTAEAKRQGIVSVFSASESAQAMEFLGRAGFTTDQIIEGLGGVMAAAAAEGIDLATSADIIAQSVKIMGLEAKDSGTNANILALASAKSNTNILALGEALKFGGLTARSAGLSMAETTAIFGKLADAGLRGSIGGTALSEMLEKLTKVGPKSTKIMKQLGIKTRGAGGKFLKMPKIINNFTKGLAKLTNEGERNAAITEIFGKRGKRAYLGLASAGGRALRQLTTELEKSSEGIGAAQEAANKRLDNLSGAIKLFASSAEAAMIEFFGPFLQTFKDTVKGMTTGLNAVLFAVQGLQKGMSELQLDENKEIGKTARLIAQGVLDAIETIKSGFNSLVARVKELGKRFGLSIGKDRIREFTKMAIVALVLAGALAPVLLGVVGIAFVLKSVLGIFVGLGQVAVGAFNLIRGAMTIVMGGFKILVGLVQSFMFIWPFLKFAAIAAFKAIAAAVAPFILPVLAVVGALIAAFALFRNEGESVGETFARMWNMIKTLAIRVFDNTIGPLIDGFVQGFNEATGGITAIWTAFVTTISTAWNDLTSELGSLFDEVFAEFSATFAEIKSVFDAVMNAIFGEALNTTDGMASSFKAWGQVLGVIAGVVLDLYVNVFGKIIKVAFGFVKLATKILITPFRTMMGVVRDVIQGIKLLFKGDFMGFLGKMGQAVTRLLTLPFQILMQTILAALSALPKTLVSKFVDDSTIKKLERFAKSGFAPGVPTAGGGRRPGVPAPGTPTQLAGVKEIMAFGVKSANRAARIQKILAKKGLEINSENVIAARNALRVAAQEKRRQKEQQKRIADKELMANVKITDESTTTVKTDLVCDGETLAKTTSKHKQTVFERNGATDDPFLRGVVAQTGARIRGNSKAG